MDKTLGYMNNLILLRSSYEVYQKDRDNIFYDNMFSFFKDKKVTSDYSLTKITNANDLAREILQVLIRSSNIKEKDIVPINSPSHFTKNSNNDLSDQALKMFSITNLVSNLNINETEHTAIIDNIHIDNKDHNTAYQIVMLLAMLKLKVYFLNDLSLIDKKLFNKVLNSIINIFKSENTFLNNSHLNTDNKSNEIVSTIENITNSKKKFSIIVDILQKKIDFSHNSHAMQFLNIVKNIPALKELTLNTLIKKTQNNDSKDQITIDEYNKKYSAISDLVKNIPIDNWLQEDQSINLQILTKRSMEFIMFSALAQKKMQEAIKNNIKSDEFYLYVLLHAASKKIDCNMDNFKKFVAEDKIDKILENPVKFISNFKNIIDEIRSEIKFNVLNINLATNKNTDYTIDKVVNDNAVRIVETPVKLNPIILTIPDHPLLTREIFKNKNNIKRGYGENRCPCGSGKKLKDCCGKKRSSEE